jgi:mRNA-degrading endonuclease RelE of RelBE toxin-antitoxin system
MAENFEIAFSQEIYKHLRAIERKYYGLIREALREHLSHTPNIETRNQKVLQKPAPFHATWELRFGPHNRFRALYEVNEEERVVLILAIGMKEGSRLFIGGEEIER